MPDLSPDELMLLEVQSAWEAFCDGSADPMAQFQMLSSSSHKLIELAFKAGYLSGAGNQLRQIQKGVKRYD